MDITGTSALVSGAASGLGAATAAALAARGAEVVGMDLPASIERATPPPGVTLVAADVTEEAPVRAALDRLRPQQGQGAAGGLAHRVDGDNARVQLGLGDDGICRCAAGENPSRNAALAASENGPRGTSSKVVMANL